MNIGQKIKVARKEKGFTQSDIADFLGTNRVAISNYERGSNTPSFANIQKLSDILGINLGSNFETVRTIRVIGTASCGGSDINHLQDNRVAYYNGNSYKPSLYCVIANGDSMSPEIEDGDEIICDGDINNKPIHGDIVHYRIGSESAIKVYTEDREANIIQLVPYNISDDFKVKTIRLDDDIEDILFSKVVAVNKLKFNNRSARLKFIGRG